MTSNVTCICGLCCKTFQNTSEVLSHMYSEHAPFTASECFVCNVLCGTVVNLNSICQKCVQNNSNQASYLTTASEENKFPYFYKRTPAIEAAIPNQAYPTFEKGINFNGGDVRGTQEVLPHCSHAIWESNDTIKLLGSNTVQEGARYENDSLYLRLAPGSRQSMNVPEIKEQSGIAGFTGYNLESSYVTEWGPKQNEADIKANPSLTTNLGQKGIIKSILAECMVPKDKTKKGRIGKTQKKTNLKQTRKSGIIKIKVADNNGRYDRPRTQMCKKCNNFIKLEEQWDHLRTVHDDWKIKCYICNMQIDQGYNYHMKKYHPGVNKSI